MVLVSRQSIENHSKMNRSPSLYIIITVNFVLIVDVDECKKSLDKCHSDADCTNNVGSYICRCKDGYLGNGFTCFKSK